MQAGYSGTPLLQKLGIKNHFRVLLIGKPDDYFELIQKDISAQLCGRGEKPDLVHLFAKNYRLFEAAMYKLKRKMKPETIIWVSWYKKSAGIATDLTEDRIRDYALQNDLVDIKVCAINELWSGLKLVVPLAKR